MAEVPNLKQYINRVSRGSEEDGTPYTIDLLGLSVWNEVLVVTKGGYMPEDVHGYQGLAMQVTNRQAELMAADENLGAGDASIQAQQEILAGKKFNLLAIIHALTANLSNRVTALEPTNL